jgi:hypothetical protein
MLVLEVFRGEGGWPFGATESAMIEAGVILIAGEVAVFAERGDVEPVAVSIEVILGEVLVPFDAVLCAEFVRFGPSVRFDSQEFDITGIVIAFDEVMAEFVQKFERRGVGGVKKFVGWRKLSALAGFDDEGWVVGAEFSDETL